jgi:spore germination cell wall hydrolase CwlJ-like protein
MFSLVPTQIGYQDLAALLTRQPAVSERWRAHVVASPFGTIHAATFSFPRPIGTMIPELPAFRLASLHRRDPDITGSIDRDVPSSQGSEPESLVFPTVNRRLKGDLLVTRPRPEPQPGGTRDLTPGRVKTVSFHRPADDPRTLEPARPDEVAEPTPEARETPAEREESPVAAQREENPVAAQREEIQVAAPPEDSLTSPPEQHALAPAQPEPELEAAAAPQTYSVASLPAPDHALPPSDAALLDPLDDANPVVRLGRLYFGNSPVGEAVGAIEPWPDGEEPVLMTAPAVDPDIKRSALAALPAARPGEDKASIAVPGETVAPKGEVTGPGKRPRTPAERLGLDAKARAKSEKCLAEAVYFESRGETKRGQIAVAQVVMNRVFSGFYPNNVCGVVYQNAHRYNACQFTFACDRIKDVVNEPDMWEQAKEIARDTLDGKLWLADIGKSTHYHAYWVHPWWVGTMRKLSRIGVHTFYRPRRWGDGADAPAWGAGILPDTAKL